MHPRSLFGEGIILYDGWHQNGRIREASYQHFPQGASIWNSAGLYSHEDELQLVLTSRFPSQETEEKKTKLRDQKASRKLEYEVLI